MSQKVDLVYGIYRSFDFECKDEYRAKSIEDDQWVNGALISKNEIKLQDGNTCIVHPETIGRKAHLHYKDKTIEAYTGDVFFTVCRNDQGEVIEPVIGVLCMEYRWDDICCFIEPEIGSCGVCVNEIDPNITIVLGNIFDEPKFINPTILDEFFLEPLYV